MARPRNPKADLHTIKIPRHLVEDLTARANELRKSMSAYVVDLIEADRVNRRKPQVVYPIGYDGPPLALVAEDPAPYGKKKLKDA